MLAPVLVALFIVVAAMLLLARRAALRLRDETTRRLPLGANGIIPGAAEFELRRGAEAPAILLLHGGGDTPQTLRYLAEYLHERGYNVRVPLLPGHGRSLREFARANAEDWLQAARSSYRELTSSNRWVALGGLSMGGALAAQLAVEDQSLPALVLLAPYLTMPKRIAFAARISRVWNPVVPYVRTLDSKARRSIHNEAEASRSLGYGVFTPAALRALYRTVVAARAALPFISSPTLMIQSREDNRVSPADAEREFNKIGSRVDSSEKRLAWITGAGHVITVDYGKEHVFELVADWLDHHRAAMPRERRA